MATSNESTSALAAASAELAQIVERAGASIVAVHGRRRLPASGIIWSHDGVIATADHVLERDEDIIVTLPDGGNKPATLVGRDPALDIAVLRLSGESTTPAVYAPADTVKVGSLVLALGRPGTPQPTASFGIISALGTQLRTARGGMLARYVRADLTFYPGFSGGAMIDAQGQIVGLNTSRLVPGLELAIPVDIVAATVKTLLTQGKVRRAYLGIITQPVALPDSIKQKLGSNQKSGLIVVGIEPNSPADQGGLLMGDIVTALGSQPTTTSDDLQGALSTVPVGSTVTLTIVRAGEVKNLSVSPGERS